jgi:hypothetical protein
MRVTLCGLLYAGFLNKKITCKTYMEESDTNSIIDFPRLDSSWFLEKNKEEIIEKEPMSSIPISFIYINLNNEIHRIISEKHELEIDEEEEDPFLSKETILYLISEKIKLENGHYRLLDILLFNIDLEPSEISSFPSCSFIKNISFLDDIVIPCSLPIFHSYNCLFIVFREISVPKKPSLVISKQDVSVLQPDHVITHHTRKKRGLVRHTRKLKEPSGSL